MFKDWEKVNIEAEANLVFQMEPLKEMGNFWKREPMIILVSSIVLSCPINL